MRPIISVRAVKSRDKGGFMCHDFMEDVNIFISNTKQVNPFVLNLDRNNCNKYYWILLASLRNKPTLILALIYKNVHIYKVFTHNTLFFAIVKYKFVDIVL